MCRDCGAKHTDPYFDTKKSSTFQPLTCANCTFASVCQAKRCGISLSYVEGSSWDAYEVRIGANTCLA
jgi:hypothetical protein